MKRLFIKIKDKSITLALNKRSLNFLVISRKWKPGDIPNLKLEYMVDDYQEYKQTFCN